MVSRQQYFDFIGCCRVLVHLGSWSDKIMLGMTRIQDVLSCHFIIIIDVCLAISFISSSQNLRLNFGQKQKKIMKIFHQTEGKEIPNFHAIILKLHLIYKKYWTIISIQKRGMELGLVTPNTFTG